MTIGPAVLENQTRKDGQRQPTALTMTNSLRSLPTLGRIASRVKKLGVGTNLNSALDQIQRDNGRVSEPAGENASKTTQCVILSRAELA